MSEAANSGDYASRADFPRFFLREPDLLVADVSLGNPFPKNERPDFRWIICSRFTAALRLDLESECSSRTKSNGQRDRTAGHPR